MEKKYDARTHGIHPVARGLRVNYEYPKCRVVAVRIVISPPPAGPTVELVDARGGDADDSPG